MTKQQLERTDELVDMARDILAGEDPMVQGATIAQLMATFIAGHHPSIRQQARADLLHCIDGLVEIEVEQLIAEKRAPADWRMPDKSTTV